MASIARPTANRAVHLRIVPRPSNLGESREIMRLISQFGEIEYFKSLKYDALSAPNAALVIYKEEQAAQSCFKRSPIRFRMGRVAAKRQATELEEADADGDSTRNGTVGTSTDRTTPRGPIGAPFALSRSPAQSRSLSTSSLPTPPPTPIRMPFDPPAPAEPPTRTAEGEESRIFQIITSPPIRHFRDHVNVNHYHGAFAIDSKMPGQADLAKRVPLLGLSCVDWKAFERPWLVIDAEKWAKRSQGSLGKLMKNRESLGEVEEDAVRDGQDTAADVSPGSSAGKSSFFTPFGMGAGREEEEGRGGRGRLSEDDTLDAIMKGWDSMFPGRGDPPESTTKERYSGKPK